MAKEAIYTFGLITFAVFVQIKGKSFQTSFFKSNKKVFNGQIYFTPSCFIRGNNLQLSKLITEQQIFSGLY